MRLTVITLSYFKKYIEREIAKATGVTVYKPFQGWREIRKKEWHFDENRPWTDAAKAANSPMKYNQKCHVEPIAEENWSIFKGDRVEILTGPDKGKIGIITQVVRERNWVFVEGLNCKYKWLDCTSTNPGVMLKTEKPLLVSSEVALVDPSDGKGARVQWRFTEDGKRARVSMRTGRIIPMSRIAEDETEDLVSKSGYIEQECDTKEADVQKVTFRPSLSTVEEDILRLNRVKPDERKRAPTYWY